MIIYRPNERVTVKIGSVSIVISPLSPADKLKVADAVGRGAQQTASEVLPMTYTALKLAVKGIDAPGYEFSDGTPITLAMGPDGNLTDEGLAVLLEVVNSDTLLPFAALLYKDGIRDWNIPGVEIQRTNKVEQQKKSQESP